MGCGCGRKNSSFLPRSRSGVQQSAALRPNNSANNNKIIGPINSNKPNVSNVSSQTPSSFQSDTSKENERRKVQKARRDAIRKRFGK